MSEPDETPGGDTMPGVPSIPGRDGQSPVRSDQQHKPDQKRGAMVCSCVGTCDIDVDAVKDAVEDVSLTAASDQICDDGTIAELASITDEKDLDEVIITCPEATAQDKLGRIEEATEATLHFVDHRERAGWIHDEEVSTSLTRRLIDARQAGLDAPPHDDDRQEITVGDDVAVIGEPDLAQALDGEMAVTLVADGNDYATSEDDIAGLDVERGRVQSVTGRYGDYQVAVESRVDDTCISCMECVEAGPDGGFTLSPVDIDPDVNYASWAEECPVDAIDMNGIEKQLDVGQVVYPGANAPEAGARGLHTEPTTETIAEVRELSGEIDEPAPLDLTMADCAAGDSGQVGCTVCTDACPHGVVDRPVVDSVVFDEPLCQTCGACTSACPTGAVSLRDPSNERIAREVEALLEAPPESGLLSSEEPPIDPQIIAFTCGERADRALDQYGRLAGSGEDVEYPPILPVEVPCGDTVGEAHVMHALAAGADGVAIIGCGGDCLHSGPDPKEALVGRMNQVTTDLGLGNRVGFFAPDPTTPDEFVENLGKFALLELDSSPVPAGTYESTGTGLGEEAAVMPYSTHTWALESLMELTEHVDPQTDELSGLESFGYVEVDDACGLTPTCSNLCPTNALRQEQGSGELEFSHERCIACGLCEDGCPETAITVNTGTVSLSNLQAEDPWEIVYEGEMFACRECGKEFASEDTVRRMIEETPATEGDLDIEGSIYEYCSDCKGEIAWKL